jgi:septum formation protein
MSFLKNISKYKIILASKSPRRQNLLKELNISFNIVTKDINEVYPDNLIKQDIPLYLAKLKASAFDNKITGNELIITADTIVWVNNTILGKPENYDDAFKMLQTLSANVHTVYTGVCLKTKEKTVAFYAETDVYFKKLTIEEIDYYLKKYKPFDKAGSYGIQEWIGYIGIEKINGSYFNVMGLPVQMLYEKLKEF